VIKASSTVNLEKTQKFSKASAQAETLRIVVANR
jgi:hypothetical protein